MALDINCWEDFKSLPKTGKRTFVAENPGLIITAGTRPMIDLHQSDRMITATASLFGKVVSTCQGWQYYDQFVLPVGGTRQTIPDLEKLGLFGLVESQLRESLQNQGITEIFVTTWKVSIACYFACRLQGRVSHIDRRVVTLNQRNKDFINGISGADDTLDHMVSVTLDLATTLPPPPSS